MEHFCLTANLKKFTKKTNVKIQSAINEKRKEIANTFF